MYVESVALIYRYWLDLESNLLEYLYEKDREIVVAQLFVNEILDERDRVLEAIRQGGTI